MQVELGEIAGWVKGEINADPASVVTGVAIDSRAVKAGDLYVAIKGENHDGHNYVRQALENGAVAAVISERNCVENEPCIIVEDTQRALGDFAMLYRWWEPLIPWVGVTGSNGKSTTRHIIAHILRTENHVCEPIKNYNNLIGMPLTILSNVAENKYGVLELGTNSPGEIARLAEIAKPTVGVITNIGSSHLEGLGSEAGVANEKKDIFSQLPDDGLAVFPADSSFTQVLGDSVHSKAEKVSFGVECPADLSAENVTYSWKGCRFTVRGVSFDLPLLGLHNVSNCMAALAVVQFFGVSLEKAAEAIRSYEQLESRQEIIRTKRYKIISDCYNANPSSLMAGVETLCNLDTGRKVLIVGDMLELGPEAADIHFEMGRWLSATKIDAILAVGKFCMALAEGAHSQNARQVVRHFRSQQSLMGHLKNDAIFDGDTILVKGSNGMKLRRLVSVLKIM